nr:hypothetical protein [Pseudoalteromonas sp. TB13]
MMKKLVSVIGLSSLFFSTALLAQTAFISSDGTGTGYQQTSPAPLSRLNTLLSDIQIDKIELKSGIYKQTNALYLNSGSHPVEVIADGRVIISSDYNFYSGGNSGFVLLRGNISFKNISFLNTRYCFRFKNTPVSNVTVNNIKAFNTMSCIDFDSNISHPVSNIKINNLKSIGYYKAGIRINGVNTTDIEILNSTFDGSNAVNDIERSCHIAGISISGTAKDVVIDNVVISNNIGGIENCGSYQQGDGIVINSGVKDVKISNAIISNSRDADLDLKGENITLKNITSSAGKEARYNLKLWNNNYTCDNCYINAANSSVIQAIDAKVTLVNSTLKLNEVNKLCDLINRKANDTQVNFSRSNFSYFGDISFVPPQLSDCQ